ncbi:MAG: hypothetical protein HYR49_05780 [Gammaproteobacteria bacterium]|nr:hypothetical protein [Gammaproteobacteria bacterium]
MQDMNGLSELTADTLLSALRRNGTAAVMVAICDLAGQLRGKTLSLEKFAASLAPGCPFPPIFPITDFADAIMPVRATPALDRLGNGCARLAPESFRDIRWPGGPRSALLMAEMTGAEAVLDPRALWARMLAHAGRAGYSPLAALEYEFTLFRETHESVHARQFRDLAPATPQSDLYGVWRTWRSAEFWDGLREVLNTAGISPEAMHPEIGRGSCEVILAPANGMRAADNAAIYRALVRAHAARHGLLATFMARWSGSAPGNSGHVHISLRNRDGAAVFHDPGAPHSLSRTCRQFIAGLQQELPQMILMLMPNVNSYRRLAPGAWSFDPRWCLWGIDNRTVPIRVLPGDAGGLHLEVRIPGADANPYLTLAAVLGAGLRGIEESLEPSEPQEGNACESRRDWPGRLRLPQTMVEAIDRFSASSLVAERFGAEFQRVFAETRRAQERESRDAVSEWELRRFLE